MDRELFKREKPKVDNVIEISNLRQIFNEGKPNEYRLFDNFSLNIPNFPTTGQLISIMGQSGSGKSQLLRAISGLTKIDEGSIKIYGKDVKDYGYIPMVFQQYSCYEWMTVLDNVALPLILRGEEKTTARTKAMELLKTVGLDEHYDKYAKTPNLSGGQLQRVSIARCLACNSQIMLLDEATSGLDPIMKRDVQNVILKIFYEAKLDPTIINVTHSIDEAVYLSNRIIIFSAKPCTVAHTIDIHFPGEEETPRGPWILETKEFVEYVGKITNLLSCC